MFSMTFDLLDDMDLEDPDSCPDWRRNPTRPVQAVHLLCPFLQVKQTK